MKHSISFLFFLFSCVLFAKAQELVTVEQVVSISLQKNYDVRLFENSAALAINDNRYAFGAFLPALNATGSYVKGSNNARVVKFDNSERVSPAAITTNTNAGIQLIWTLFDGTKMFATRGRISKLAELGAINVKNQMVNSAATVIATYYGIVRQKQQLKAIVEQMSVSEERVKLAERKLQVGTGGKPELLQAKVDLNAFRTAKLQQETLIQQLKDQLNSLLGMGLPDTFETADSIPIDLTLDFAQITSNIENTNQQLASVRKNIEVMRQTLKENRAGRSPIINFVSNYNFIQRQENEVEVQLGVTPKVNENKGYNFGLNATLPIMNGMNVNRLIGQSKVNIERQKLIYDQQLTIALVGVRIAYTSYQNAIQVLRIEEENSVLAKENVTIALEGFRRGITTFIELRTAQQSLADAFNRLIAARYNSKISETELLRLQGSLVN